jgi:hypothetical protein
MNKRFTVQYAIRNIQLQHRFYFLGSDFTRYNSLGESTRFNDFTLLAVILLDFTFLMMLLGFTISLDGSVFPLVVNLIIPGRC